MSYDEYLDDFQVGLLTACSVTCSQCILVHQFLAGQRGQSIAPLQPFRLQLRSLAKHQAWVPVSSSSPGLIIPIILRLDHGNQHRRGVLQRKARSSNRSSEHFGQMEDMVQNMTRMIDQQRRVSGGPASFSDFGRDSRSAALCLACQGADGQASP